jgi:hypothetical protein
MAKVAHFAGHFEKCAHFFWAFSAVCTEFFGPSPCCALVLLQSAQVFLLLLHFASSVHSFLLPSAPKFRRSLKDGIVNLGTLPFQKIPPPTAITKKMILDYHK